MFLSNFVILLALILFPSLVASAQHRPKKNSPAQIQQKQPRTDPLFEVGRASRLRQRPETATELKIISYNIRWRGGEDLRELIKLFHNDSQIGGAAVLGLQEVDRNKKRTENVNTAKLIADELGMYYAWTAPPAPTTEKEEETGVAIMSLYPLTDIQPLVLPHEGPGHRRRAALGATVKIGATPLRIYSVHSETRIPVELKMEQLQTVLQDLDKHDAGMPAIVLGDFNTWEPSAVTKTHKLFEGKNFRTPIGNQPTFLRKILFFPLKLKLDWIWVRNIEVIKAGIDRSISLSDHWPLWTIAKLPAGMDKKSR